jgi:hypothetical protein
MIQMQLPDVIPNFTHCTKLGINRLMETEKYEILLSVDLNLFVFESVNTLEQGGL